VSIQHLEAAAETPLHATSKLVLMAIADDANKLTRLAYPGMPKMVLWSGASERRIFGILEELIAEQFVARCSFGKPGRRTEWLIFPTAEEIEALDALNPELNRVSAEAMRRVHAAIASRAEKARIDAEKEAAREAKRAARAVARPAMPALFESVDNSEGRVPPVAPFDATKGATQSKTTATHGTPTVITSPVYPSHVENTHQTAVGTQPIDDDEIHPPTPLDLARSKKLTIDYEAIREALAPLALEVTVTDTIAGLAARRVLQRAAGRVANPTGFVLTAIRNPDDRIDWQAWLLGVENDIAAAAAEAGGNPF
jgi:hypothetical protein